MKLTTPPLPPSSIRVCESRATLVQLPIGQLARTNVLLILIFTSVFILLALKMFLPIRFQY